jgi:carbamoyl-phosphate synthase/aspartate carbamoyltransferase/dihydroorotase
LVALHGQNGLKLREISRLEDVMAETDVLYVTRAQYERFKESDPLLYESVKQSYQSYTVTPDTLSHAKSDLVLMHPFPRNDEISREVDTDPRFAIFEQIENGMYLRMALFAMILGRV